MSLAATRPARFAHGGRREKSFGTRSMQSAMMQSVKRNELERLRHQDCGSRYWREWRLRRQKRRREAKGSEGADAPRSKQAGTQRPRLMKLCLRSRSHCVLKTSGGSNERSRRSPATCRLVERVMDRSTSRDRAAPLSTVLAQNHFLPRRNKYQQQSVKL